MKRHWSAGYIGLPFREKGRGLDGADCWGLICLVYAAELSIELPSYVDGYVSLEERTEISGLIDKERSKPVWSAINDKPQEFDVALFRLGRLGAHVGIVVDQAEMLHVVEDEHARIENFTGPRFASRLISIYRHQTRKHND